MCATNLACFFACFRCTECIESIYACTFSGVGARFEQVEERGGPSVQWPFEKFVKEMHKAIVNDCDESRLVFGVEVITTVTFLFGGRKRGKMNSMQLGGFMEKMMYIILGIFRP